MVWLFVRVIISMKNNHNYIYIASINRSGGSLLARLLDGHPDIASYPLELRYPIAMDVYPFVDYLTGTPRYIREISAEEKVDLLEYFDIPQQKQDPIYKWGKERSDPIGVRQNYVEKERYDRVETSFEYHQYIEDLKSFAPSIKTVQDAYNAKDIAYFDAWDKGAHKGAMKFVVWHDSGGIFLVDFSQYFEQFPESLVVFPIRHVFGYIGSEKTRLARRYYGSRRFPKFPMPNILVKHFSAYDLDALIRTWLVEITRGVLLQEKFGVNDKFLVYRYENLVERPESVMRYLCEKIQIPFEKTLLNPTIIGQPWSGSSHQGRQAGINLGLSNYYREVLTQDEIDKIYEHCSPILEHLESDIETPTDLTKIQKNDLYDYDYQKYYSSDKRAWALYSAFSFNSSRRTLIGTPNGWALFAYLYSKLIAIVHIPRLLRQRWFPGRGKQNYT
jgi:hypothetical protein